MQRDHVTTLLHPVEETTAMEQILKSLFAMQILVIVCTVAKHV